MKSYTPRPRLAAAVLTPALACGLAAAAHAAPIVQWNFNSPVDDNTPTTGTTDPNLDLVPGNPTSAFIGSALPQIFVTGDLTFGVQGSSDPVVGTSSSATNDSALSATGNTVVNGNNVPGAPAQGTASGTFGTEYILSTAGYRDVSVTFDIRPGASSGAKHYRLFWANGSQAYDEARSVLYTLADEVYTSDNLQTWRNGLTSGPLGATADDQTDFRFKIVAVFAPGTSVYEPIRSSSTYAQSNAPRFDMVTVNANPIPEPAVAGLAGLIGLGLAARRRR